MLTSFKARTRPEVKRRKVSIPGLPRGAAAAAAAPGGQRPKAPMLRANRILRSSTMEQRQQRDETKAARGRSSCRRRRGRGRRSGAPQSSAEAGTEATLVGRSRCPELPGSNSAMVVMGRLTQEQRLEEAVRTEERSREEFKVLQSEEDERRRSRRRQRRVMYDGPRIRFVSRISDDVVEPLIGGRPGVENAVHFIDCNFQDFCGGAGRNVPRPLETAATRQGQGRSPAPKKSQKAIPTGGMPCIAVHTAICGSQMLFGAGVQ
eukprot:Skav231913  [mRNA]  locus=scaffold344:105768:113703:- [translate_table: standard]